MTLDTSLSKLTRNAFAILSGAYAKLPEIAIDAIAAENSRKQPRLYNQLIQVSVLFRQINSHIVYNDAGTAIIGIQGEDVKVINDLLLCLKEVAELSGTSQFPTPLTNIDFTQVQYVPMPVGPPGSILVSDGTSWQIHEKGDDGDVLTSTSTGLVWSSVVGNGIPAGGLAGQFLIKNSNTSYDVIWDTLTLSQVTDVTASPAEINILDGVDTVNIGPTQINTLNGINTATTIQVQIDGKLSSTLPDNNFWIGSDLNVAVPMPPSGDVTFNNNGVFAISPLVIVNADVSPSAGIMRGKLASGSSWRLVINNSTGQMSEAAAIFANRALISDANGIPTHSSVTSTVLGYISTLNSNAQDQLNTKLTVSLTSVAQGDIITYNGTNWVNLGVGSAGQVITTDGTSVSWGSSTSNGIPVGGTTHQILRKIDNTNYNTEWHTLVLDDLTDVVTTATEVNLLSGLTVSSTFLNFTDGVHTNIQDQLDTKLPISLTHHSIWIGGPGNTAQQTSAGVDGAVLTIVSGHPTWQTPPAPGNVSGPVSSTDHAVVRWNGTSGDSIQDSGVIMDDSNNITGVASLSSGQIDILNQAELRLHETGSTNYVAIRAAGTMASNYTITLPDAAPSANTALTYDGANYVWSASGGAVAFTDLTDTPANYTGSAGLVVVVNATEDGLEFVAGGGTGTVTSVSGTTDRITITGTATINPTVDIAATYVGQASITTLGTVATGVWNATNISLAKGGTGASLTDPNVDRVLFWDDSAGAVTWLEVGSGLSISGTVLTATGSYTDELAQDAVGNILTDTATIDFIYNDGAAQITADVINHSIGNAQIREGVGLSVIGRATNTTGDVDDISGTDGQVLRIAGTTLDFGSIGVGSINMNTNRILGRTSPSAGAVEEITVTNGLTFSSTTLKLGGTLSENTHFVGAGFSFTGSGFSSVNFSANEFFAGTPIGGKVLLQNVTDQTLHLGGAAGAVFNLGGDATGDMYYRNSSGKFDRMIIGSVGQTMIVSTSGIPIWSNIIIETVSGSTYEFTNADNGKLKVFLNALGTAATIPSGTLDSGWQVLCYRADGAGTVTFDDDGGTSTLEGVGTTMPTPETMVSITQRATDIFILTGALTTVGTGTVTSVGLNPIAGIISVSGSPVVTTGDFTMTLDNQIANTGFFGPVSGASAAPTFRAMVLRDLPNDSYEEITGTTYSFVEDDNKKIKFCTHVSGCVITIPSALLSSGWASTVYRLGGTVSFISDGTSVLEGAGTSIPVVETYAMVSHRALNTFVIAGALSVGGGGGASNFTDLLDTPSAYTGHAGKVVAVNGTETGLEFITAGAGTVTSVSGTANRITSTGGLTPVIDIAATYVGQSSLTTLGTITTGVWNGTSIGTGFTDAKVVSISGVTNRTTISGTTTVPIVDIAATYVGQSSITTLGTITTGTWTGTTIAATNGGTGLTSIGTANQVLGVNNAGTALEYKSITLGTTAQSNNLGWVLTGANSIVLHVPDASATVRGVVTTGTQTFSGPKTFTGNNSASNAFKIDSGLGFGITMYVDAVAGVNYIIGYGATNDLFVSANSSNALNLFGRSVLMNPTGAGGAPVVITSSSSLLTPKNLVAIGATFSNIITGGNSIQLNINGTYSQVTGSTTVSQKTLYINPTIINTSAGASSTNYGILYSPTETNLTNTTHYGIVINSSTALSGFGVLTPTSRVHIGAGSTTVAPFKITSSAGSLVATISGGVQDGAVEYDGTHLYVVIGSTRYQLDQQGGGGGVTDGDKGDVTVTGSGTVWTIDNDAVTYAKIQNVSATSRILGRITSGAGDIEELTGTQATTLLDIFSTSATTKGLVPGSNGVGNTFFLRADGTWAVPSGGGGSFTNTAANTELAMSDGTNLDPSGVFIPSAGSLTLGSASIAGDRTITASSSTTNSSVSIIPQASGNVNLNVNATGVVRIGSTSVTGNRAIETGSSSTNANLSISSKGTGVINFVSGGFQLNGAAGSTNQFFRYDGTWALAVPDGDRGDITVSSSGTVWTIDNNAVTLAKMADIATSSFIGRVTASTGDPEVLTGTQATTLLDLFSTSTTTKGLVPGSNGASTANFLRADGTWAAPAAISVAGSDTEVQYNASGVFAADSQFVFIDDFAVGTGKQLRVGPSNGDSVFMSRSDAVNYLRVAKGGVNLDVLANAISASSATVISTSNGDLSLTAAEDLHLNAAGGFIDINVSPSANVVAASTHTAIVKFAGVEYRILLEQV